MFTATLIKDGAKVSESIEAFAQLMNAAAIIKHRDSANIFLNLFSIFILFSELCRQPKVHILYYIIVAESFYKVTTCYLRFSPF